MQEKVAALWLKFQEHLRSHLGEIKEQGLTKVIREQSLGLWAKAQDQGKVAWQWVTARISAVPMPKQVMVHVAVGLAAVSLWVFREAIPGAMPAAMSLTMVVAYLALIMALLAYGGVSVIFDGVKSAEAAVE